MIALIQLSHDARLYAEERASKQADSEQVKQLLVGIDEVRTLLQSISVSFFFSLISRT